MKTHPFGTITEFCRSEESYHLAGSYGSFCEGLRPEDIATLMRTYLLASPEIFGLEVAYLAVLYTIRLGRIFPNKKPA